MIITIDGPTASGKSSTAKALAKKLGFYYLNTGLMYRAIAWLVQNENFDISTLGPKLPFEYRVENDQPKIFVDGKDITSQLFSSEISKEASILSKNKYLHDALVKYQQSFANKGDLVVEGRIAGTIVFPNADLKVYLTASDKVRAKRWLADPARNNQAKTIEQAMKAIQQRDQRDKERKISPLVVPENAFVIDSSDKNLEQVTDLIYQKCTTNH